MQLIVVSGLPGTGKSTVAEGLSRGLVTPVFAKDWLDAALLRSGLGDDPERRSKVGHAGYELLETLAERQFHVGQSAILDSVCGYETVRRRWRELAATQGATFVVIECVCSDESVHRSRIDGRQRGIPGWYELEWSDVEDVRGRFEPWEEHRVVLDSVQPPSELLAAALAYVRGEAGWTPR